MFAKYKSESSLIPRIIHIHVDYEKEAKVMHNLRRIKPRDRVVNGIEPKGTIES